MSDLEKRIGEYNAYKAWIRQIWPERKDYFDNWLKYVSNHAKVDAGVRDNYLTIATALLEAGPQYFDKFGIVTYQETAGKNTFGFSVYHGAEDMNLASCTREQSDIALQFYTTLSGKEFVIHSIVLRVTPRRFEEDDYYFIFTKPKGETDYVLEVSGRNLWANLGGAGSHPLDGAKLAQGPQILHQIAGEINTRKKGLNPQGLIL